MDEIARKHGGQWDEINEIWFFANDSQASKACNELAKAFPQYRFEQIADVIIEDTDAILPTQESISSN